MLEMFLAALEDELGLIVSPPLAPVARMGIVMDEITRLIRAAELQRAPVQSEQPCPYCGGRGYYAIGVYREDCDSCNGTGKSNRSDGG